MTVLMATLELLLLGTEIAPEALLTVTLALPPAGIFTTVWLKDRLPDAEFVGQFTEAD